MPNISSLFVVVVVFIIIIIIIMLWPQFPPLSDLEKHEMNIKSLVIVQN